uniref:Mfs-type transporter n=1 Tax=Ixodes ricinus TaxID=34613 RepID=V5HF02_IXORI
MSSPLLVHVSAGSRPRFNDGSTEFSQHRQNNSVPEHCEDSLQNSTEDVEKSPKPSPLCEKLRSSVWGLTYVYQTFWIAAINSLLAPFFPALAALRGNNTWLFGTTLSVFNALMLPGSFLAEILITKKSLKFAYLTAVTGLTIYALLCGAMYWIDEENSFVGVAIFNAAFGGTSMAIFLVSIITAFTSDSNGGLWMGIKENVSGIGGMLGQVGGGFFIDHWKYPTPFFAFAIALVLVIPFIKVPHSESLEKREESPGRVDEVNEECDQVQLIQYRSWCRVYCQVLWAVIRITYCRNAHSLQDGTVLHYIRPGTNCHSTTYRRSCPISAIPTERGWVPERSENDQLHLQFCLPVSATWRYDYASHCYVYCHGLRLPERVHVHAGYTVIFYVNYCGLLAHRCALCAKRKIRARLRSSSTVARQFRESQRSP